jgi:hypothetical protein
LQLIKACERHISLFFYHRFFHFRDVSYPPLFTALFFAENLRKRSHAPPQQYLYAGLKTVFTTLSKQIFLRSLRIFFANFAVKNI